MEWNLSIAFFLSFVVKVDSKTNTSQPLKNTSSFSDGRVSPDIPILRPEREGPVNSYAKNFVPLYSISKPCCNKLYNLPSGIPTCFACSI